MFDMSYNTGELIQLKEGWYFRVKHEKETRRWERSIHPRTFVANTEQGLILEHQGTKADNQCWHVLVNGAVIIAWDNDFTGYGNECS